MLIIYLRAHLQSKRKSMKKNQYLPAEMSKILLQIASFSSAYLDMLPQNTQFSQRIFNISASH